MNNLSDDKQFSLNAATPLSEQQQAELAALAAMSDEDIDYSDSPPLTEAFWQNAVSSNPLNLPKQQNN
jgi:hypothetical protein